MINTGVLRYDNNGSLIDIKELKTNVDYDIRIEMINDINKIYLDRILVYETGIKSTNFATGNRIFFQGIGEHLLK